MPSSHRSDNNKCVDTVLLSKIKIITMARNDDHEERSDKRKRVRKLELCGSQSVRCLSDPDPDVIKLKIRAAYLSLLFPSLIF